MEKMIIGLILSAAGGFGFLLSIRGIVDIATTVTGIPGWGVITEPALDLNIIFFIDHSSFDLFEVRSNFIIFEYCFSLWGFIVRVRIFQQNNYFFT